MARQGGVEELVASVRSNVEVIRDAMKEPMTEDSHAIVSELMLDVKQSQESLQKRASEMVESGNFGSTGEIFETIDLVTNLEPQFEEWIGGTQSGNANIPEIGGSIHMEPPIAKSKKKKKKKKQEETWEDPTAGPPRPSGWEAFPPPTGWPVEGGLSAQAAEPAIPPPSIGVSTAPASARLTLGMNWATLGPLLGDPGSSEEVRKQRLGDLMKEAIASECGITLDRIRIKQVC